MGAKSNDIADGAAADSTDCLDRTVEFTPFSSLDPRKTRGLSSDRGPGLLGQVLSEQHGHNSATVFCMSRLDGCTSAWLYEYKDVFTI